MNLNTDYLIKLAGQISPAPWKVIDGWDENGDGKYFPSVQISDNPGKTMLVVNVSHDSEKTSLMANARLMAGAPELLAEVITLNKHNGVAQKTINRLCLELAEEKAKKDELYMALQTILEACHRADFAGDLSGWVTGEMMEAAELALEWRTE